MEDRLGHVQRSRLAMAPMKTTAASVVDIVGTPHRQGEPRFLIIEIDMINLKRLSISFRFTGMAAFGTSSHI